MLFAYFLIFYPNGIGLALSALPYLIFFIARAKRSWEKLWGSLIETENILIIFSRSVLFHSSKEVLYLSSLDSHGKAKFIKMRSKIK